MAVIKLKILTPKGCFFKGEVEFINFYNSIGKIEILPRHITYMSEILPSVFEIKQGGILKKAVITEGAVDFKKNEAIVMAEAAEWPDQIDIERAKRAYDRAKQRIKSRDPEIDIKRAELALSRASARLKCANSINKPDSQ